MSVLTKGPLPCRGLGLSIELPLEQIHARLSAAAGTVGRDYGWGSINDGHDTIGKFGVQEFSVGRPELVAADERRGMPRRIKGRFYWWQFNQQAQKIQQSWNEPERATQLNALDFIIAEDSTANTYLTVVTTRDLREIQGYFKEQLLSILSEEGGGASITLDTSPLDLIDQEFFFWLMYRFHHAPQITADIVIRDLREISGQDIHRRKANLGDGVTLDRAELLSMIMSGGTDFGPASVALDHESLELAVDVKLFVDGGFTPSTSRSSYDERELRARPNLGPRLVDDLTFRVIPEMRHAFNSDNEWRTGSRNTYVAEARTSLTAILARLAG